MLIISSKKEDQNPYSHPYKKPAKDGSSWPSIVFKMNGFS
ncbi:hypothetical protein QY95_03540 [Bacillus thermotolerans]|uniref:Uncharacterized protein n=1 Tax=Bacillus thermotolerans TaxID=1221996 RepID=A0A0F5HPK8_BACTR|nr:hypothetical protein QY95_03540 [Bacillus thermotolerans]